MTADLILLTAALAAVPQDLRLEVVPPEPLIERLRSHHSLQCDFILRNDGAARVSIDEVRVDELDHAGVLIRRRTINRNGTAPSILTLRNATVPSDGFVHLFNPFHHLESDAVPARFVFRFSLRSNAAAWTESVTVDARVYETRTPLRLPMVGRVAVDNGHDYLSHHRRVGFDHPGVRVAGLTVNSGRYALDLVVVDEHGEPAPSSPSGHEDSFTWDAPVVAPGSGRVVLAVDDFPDNRSRGGRVVLSPRVTPTDISTFAGNVVVIDHGNGEVSALAHLREGSVEVEVGQEVTRGDPIGRVGLSGASDHVHLHYQLQDGVDLADSFGLPASFEAYRLWRGSASTVVRDAPADTGDVVEHVETATERRR